MIGEVSMVASSEGGGEGRAGVGGGGCPDSDGARTRARPGISQVWSQAWEDKHKRYDYSKRELSCTKRGENAARCYLKWRRKQEEEEDGGGELLELSPHLHHTREHSYRATKFSGSSSTIFILILLCLFNFFEYSQGT